MPKITLTDFVDVVSAAGTPKATKVKQLKQRPAYHPARDYYKILRDHLVETHRCGGNRADLSKVLNGLVPKKQSNYEEIITGYSKWWGRKNITWFDPTTAIFDAHGIDVSINPEMGLQFNGEKHLIKLYFKSEKLTKNRVHLITHLMEQSLPFVKNNKPTMSVLDIRNSKLISPNVPIPELDATLNAELAYIAALWEAI